MKNIVYWLRYQWNLFQKLNWHYIMMLIKFADSSKSNRSNLFMSRIDVPDLGGTIVPNFHKKCKKMDNIAVYFI